MEAKRIKVDIIHPQNLFFEKVLTDWKDNASDKNGASVIKRALDNLKKFPGRINGFPTLKLIKGIGEDIATRLDASLKLFTENNAVGGQITLQQVRSLNKSDALLYLLESTVSKGRKNIPFLAKDAQISLRGIAAEAKSQAVSSQKSSQSNMNVDNSQSSSKSFGGSGGSFKGKGGSLKTKSSEDFGSSGPKTSNMASGSNPFSGSAPFSQSWDINRIELEPTTSLDGFESSQASSSIPNKENTPSSSSNSQNPPITTFNPPEEIDNLDETIQQINNDLLEYKPGECLPQLLLLVDNRENRQDGKNKSIAEQLYKKGVAHDLRPLSVGDYMWVLKMGDGPESEMVMDYIIERKTWDDLKTSIRQSRYHEQKQRLKQSGCKNVIMLIEGTFAKSEASLEQALISTFIQEGYLIQRVQNPAETAKFLADLTQHLLKKLNNEEMCGLSFAAFQDESRKTKEITVADCFLKQLTVCPRMSSKKAALIVQAFPSLRALKELYNNSTDFKEEVLARAVPGIPGSLSKQISMFFS